MQMISSLCSRVRSALSNNRFPVIHGADCAVLLGAVPALPLRRPIRLSR